MCVEGNGARAMVPGHCVRMMAAGSVRMPSACCADAHSAKPAPMAAMLVHVQHKACACSRLCAHGVMPRAPMPRAPMPRAPMPIHCRAPMPIHCRAPMPIHCHAYSPVHTFILCASPCLHTSILVCIAIRTRSPCQHTAHVHRLPMPIYALVDLQVKLCRRLLGQHKPLLHLCGASGRARMHHLQGHHVSPHALPNVASHPP